MRIELPATAPVADPASIGNCKQLATAVAANEEARRVALEKQQGAWKVVLPFAVVARYAAGKAELKDAEERRATLQRELAQRGCAER